MNLTIALLAGDGIGPEVVEQTLRVLDTFAEFAKDISFRFEEHSVGAGEHLKNGNGRLGGNPN